MSEDCLRVTCVCETKTTFAALATAYYQSLQMQRHHLHTMATEHIIVEVAVDVDKHKMNASCV